MDETREQARRARRWTVAWVLVGCALRLARPTVHSFWIDEGMTVRIASAADPYAFFAHDSHPPLSFLLVRAWMKAFGTEDLALRLLPAITSCASLLVFATLARAWLGRGPAIGATLAYAVAPILVGYAHEVRMYAFVELATLLVLSSARGAWTRPTLSRFTLVAVAVAVATGLHYYGALAGIAVVAQAACARARPWIPTGLAAAAGVLAWAPWIVAYLPAQTSGVWPVVAHTSARDLAELPARLFAADFAVLREHGLTWVGWGLGTLCVLGLALGAWRVLVRREPGPRDALIAALAPVFAALLLAVLAGGGFHPRYLTPAIPGTIAVVAYGLLALRPAGVAHLTLGLLLVLGTAMTILQLSMNRREDYRTAAAEVRERWQPGDRLLLLVCVPDIHVPAAIDHYLRDRPDILAARLDAERHLAGADLLPSGTRIHVVWREATICWEPMQRLASTHAIVERAPERFRIHRMLALAP